jgi:ubiquinone/menaquinone biosynthesis C-methylase UbiE
LNEQYREWFNDLAGRWDSIHPSYVKERLREIISPIELPPEGKILDVGTGTGIMIPMLLEKLGPKGEVWALDIAEKMLEAARAKVSDNRVRFVHADVMDIPAEEGTFDAVVCNSCLPHFPDKPGSLRELFRVTRPGGTIIICHADSRDHINNRHREIGGLVANDLIPEAGEMRAMLKAARFSGVWVTDARDRFIALGRK